MSHEMYENDHALYVGKPAWHGLGTVIENVPTIAEALELSKMDFTVTLSNPLVAKFLDPSLGYDNNTKQSKFYATVRTDTNEVLGVVNKNYKIVQNSELFDIAGSVPGLQVETAGTLFNGAQSYVLMKDSEWAVNGNDVMHEYLCLMNSHNGTLSLSALPTSVRVVCNNTLSWAISEGQQRMIKLRHKGDMKDKILGLKEALDEWNEHKSKFRNIVSALGRKKWSKEEITNFWTDCYQMFEGEIPMERSSYTEEEHNSRKKAMTTLLGWSETFDKETEEFGNSAWIAANAVTNWLQNRKRRTTEATISNKLIGEAAKNSTRVMRHALTLV
jgi:phage/plasmid-like protein (TIGR03299 family)